jgi:cytochrome b561
MWRNTSDGYGLIQILLHWASALLIAVLLPLGLWMTELTYYDPWYTRAPDLHRALGVLFGLLLAVRWLAGRLQVRPQPLAHTHWERRGASLGHALLYLLPALLVVSGYLISTADGRAVDVFGWFAVPATLHGLDGQEDIAGELHFWLSMVLLVLVVLHVGAALRHHFVLEDATLRRMLKPSYPTEANKEQP